MHLRDHRHDSSSILGNESTDTLQVRTGIIDNIRLGKAQQVARRQAASRTLLATLRSTLLQLRRRIPDHQTEPGVLISYDEHAPARCASKGVWVKNARDFKPY